MKQLNQDLKALGIDAKNATRISTKSKGQAATALVELIELMNSKELTVDYLKACKVVYSSNDCRVLVRHDGLVG